MKTVVAVVVSAAAFAVMSPSAGNAQASCVAFNGRTSANGYCTADAGSLAVVIGSASQAAAKGRGSLAVVIGNGSASLLAKGDNNVGIVVGQRSRATSQGGGEGGNRLVVFGNDSSADNIDGTGNTVRIRGDRNIVTTNKTGYRATIRGNDQSVTVPKP